MYKCKECGAEYEEKPDYCDCGNDEFEELGAGVNQSGVNAVVNKQVNVKENAAQNEQITEIPQENAVEEKPKVQPASSMNFNNSAQEMYIPKRALSIDPVSLFIFIICIFMSLYVIFFAWNPKAEENADSNKATTQTAIVNKNIPSIDKIWNNAVPVVKKEEPKKEEKVENIIKQIIPVQISSKTETPKKAVSTVQPKVTKVPLTKVTTNQKKPVVNKTASVTKTTVNNQEQEKVKAEAIAKQKAEQERKAAEAEQLKKLQEIQVKKAAEQKAQRAAAAKQEYAAYKVQLRNAIGRKIDFTRVIGDGSCTVAFKIDSTGRLINRSFAKQSSNNTLNDAVYNAVMSTPSFNPPPSAYNNEVLNLNIRFTNGNFEISLP